MSSPMMPFKIPFKLLACATVSALITTGCATQYGCKGQPNDPVCLSTTEAYQVSDKPLAAPSKTDTRECPPLADAPNAESAARPKIDDPTPIRTPSRVMRVWIAPWEDAEGVLMVSNYVYTDLEPRRGLIGKSAPTVSPSLIPLQIEHRQTEPKRSERENEEVETLPPPPAPPLGAASH